MHGMPNVLSMHHASYDCIYLLQKLPGLQQTEKVLAYKKATFFQSLSLPLQCPYSHPFSKILLRTDGAYLSSCSPTLLHGSYCTRLLQARYSSSASLSLRDSRAGSGPGALRQPSPMSATGIRCGSSARSEAV